MIKKFMLLSEKIKKGVDKLYSGCYIIIVACGCGGIGRRVRFRF